MINVFFRNFKNIQFETKINFSKLSGFLITNNNIFKSTIFHVSSVLLYYKKFMVVSD